MIEISNTLVDLFRDYSVSLSYLRHFVTDSEEKRNTVSPSRRHAISVLKLAKVERGP
jgi:hypothetical protein